MYTDLVKNMYQYCPVKLPITAPMTKAIPLRASIKL